MNGHLVSGKYLFILQTQIGTLKGDVVLTWESVCVA